MRRGPQIRRAPRLGQEGIDLPELFTKIIQTAGRLFDSIMIRQNGSNGGDDLRRRGRDQQCGKGGMVKAKFGGHR